jgi:prepilin-type N-terminal cleavage/methylation domain-containing protein
MDVEDRQHPLIRRALTLKKRGEQGFSLVEVLIAAAIFLVVALGIVPLFAQAIVNNRSGADYTTATNLAKSELERLYALPMMSPELEITTTTTVKRQYFSQAQNVWVDTLSASDLPQWTRTVTLRQYGIGGFVDVDRDGVLDGPLPPGSESHVQVKEIEGPPGLRQTSQPAHSESILRNRR